MTNPSSPPARPKGVTRRHFIQTSSVLGGQVLLLQPGQAAGNSLEGYTAAPSAPVGGTMDFYLRDPQALGTGTTVYPITFTRIGSPDVFMSTTTVVVGNQPVPADASTNGCRWARSHRLLIPTTWPSGLYYAYVGSGANACTVPFVVRPVSPTAGVKTIVNVPVLTVHAYNAYGGKSIYDYNSTGGVRASQVSLDRPFTEAFNSFFDTWSQYLVRWLAKNNLAADFCTDVDIEVNPSVLAGYQLYVQAGHDEYWSSGRRDTLDAFIAAGGNAAFLGGNTSWFQSRLQIGNGVANRTLVCYKDAATDPVTDPALETINFISLATPRPENLTTGLGFVTGCSWAGSLPRPNTPSVVMRPEHWAFAGTGLARGAGFGGAFVGYECDSAAFVNGADGRPYPTAVDGSPATLRILAQADGSNWNQLSLDMGGGGEMSGYAAIAIYSRGGAAGTVFNAGSTDWAYGLRPELDGQTPSPISRITLNVINKLAAPWSETADVRQFRAGTGSSTLAYWTTGTAAPAGSGMALDGWVFRAFVAPEANTVPIYRLRSLSIDPTRRYYLLRRSAIALGVVVDGIAFYAYATARTDTLPVYEHSIFNFSLLAMVTYYSTSATPPPGFIAGPVVFHTPIDGLSVGAPINTGLSFTLAPLEASISLNPGASVWSEMITVNPLNGFNGSVTFAVSGLPAGASVSLQPATSKGGTKLRIVTQASTPVGSYNITVSGTSPGVAGTVTTVLRLVVFTPVPRFTLVPLAGTIRVIQGRSTLSEMVKVSPFDDFDESVTFSVDGLPAGITTTLQPSRSKGGTKLLVLARTTAEPGSYPIMVTGSVPGIAAPASVVLTLVITRR